MAKALAIGTSLLLLAGCVSVNTSSTPPSAGPSFGITTPHPASPTLPTIVLTPAPVVTEAPTEPPPTEEPTAPPATQAPTAVATAETTEPPSSGSADVLFEDDMTDPTSGWGTGDTALVTTSYQGDALNMVVHTAGGAGYSPRDLGAEFGTLIAAGEFTAGADGAFGVLCGAAGPVFYGALVTTNGGLVMFSIVGGEVTVLDSINDIGLDVPVGEPTFFGLECSGTATGALRLVPVMSGTGPLAVYQSLEGPESFTGLALYGEAVDAEFSLDIGQAIAYGIAGSADGPTPEAADLLTHVPEPVNSSCIESPVTQTEVAVLHCYLQPEGTGAELAEYQQFASNTDMDAAYQENVDRFGIESQGSCETGPNETSWNVGGVDGGRVQCAPQQVGIRFDWTDDALVIMASLFDFDADYQNTFDLWVNAGPI